MLGNNKRREKKLRGGSGRQAPAEILEAKPTSMSVTHGNEAIVANTEIVWKLKLCVRPPGEPEFEVKLEQRYGQLSQPMVGSLVNVLYDPGDHGKVAIDHDEKSMMDAAISTAAARHAGSDPTKAAAIGDLMRAAVADPQAFREQMAARQAGAGGANIFQLAPDGSLAPVGGAPLPADPLDRLAKLAALHDRGVLTDEEFAAQKAKILAEE